MPNPNIISIIKAGFDKYGNDPEAIGYYVKNTTEEPIHTSTIENIIKQLAISGAIDLDYKPPQPKKTKRDRERELNTQKKVPTKLNAENLRKLSLEKYKEAIEKGFTPIIKDESKGEKTYKGLTKVWMPLILDQATPPQEPWTIDEIIGAMMPVIKRFAFQYSGMRAGYQVDDAISDGQDGVLKALRNDMGNAPFGLYAAREIMFSITKGAKGAGLIRTPTRKRGFTDSTASLDKPSSLDPSLSMAGTIPSSAGVAVKIDCPACEDGKIIDPETGEKLRCDVCKGQGTINVPDPRAAATPEEEAQENEKTKKLKIAISHITSAANLSERQTEILLLQYGLEGLFDPNLVDTRIERMPTAISNVLSYADAIHRQMPPELVKQDKEDTGIWVEAEKQGKTEEFQRIWDAAFGNIPHKPFNPKLPASLQIAPLTSAVAGDKLEQLMAMLQKNIADIPPVQKSKQFAGGQIKNLHKKIEALRTSGGLKDTERKIEDVIESIELVLEYGFQSLLEHIAAGAATNEDIAILGYIV